MDADARKPHSDTLGKTAEYVFTETWTINVASIARLTPIEAERVLDRMRRDIATGTEVPGSLILALLKRTAREDKIPKPKGLKKRSAEVAIGEARTKI